MKKLLIALLVLGLLAPGMAMAQNLDQRVTELENNMQEFARQGMKLKETVIGMKKFGFHWYGSFRTHLGYYDVDQEYAAGAPAALRGPQMDGTVGHPYDDDAGTVLGFGGNGKVGAKAIINEDFYGIFEVGLKEEVRGSSEENIYMRLAYGVWDFGNGELAAGKSYTPATFLGYSKMQGDLSDLADANMLVAGLPYIGRQPLVQLSFGDFEISLIEPNKGAADYQDTMSAYGDALPAPYDPESFVTDVDFVLPRIEAAHVFRLNDGKLNIRPVLGYQTYDVEVYDLVAGGDDSESIDSFIAGIGVSADLGPAYVKGTASYLQNASNYGASNYAQIYFREAMIDPATGNIEDSTSMQGTLVAGFKVNDMLSLEGGLSYQNSEIDLTATQAAGYSGGAVTTAATGEQTAFVYYLQGWYSLSENMSIIPEIGMVDRGDLEVGSFESDLGSMTYLDVNFRVDF